ncbi:caspase family protein [Bacteroides cellulosilyticus]|uniref:caspase family protein n=1 Tax=Bacteroides cellulosilyticus TaxID=246787 RepID=UPI001C377B21|nr:caspase family protein [Bacteroides cellulosilyticus]MBV3638576.1 caspase family protein [Bacteroides cellulosilyticus]MBV3664263.1 caspase family protein [Bacteroides cellulosilyticus]MBV3686164.1 caspase family protein [Bacteroides cellulosilyticus]MBV3694745.1 caspase family protein [Bacteroides cellulosilyticus]MBV3708461.1 caspase family protein [Bacteroides cellulosilyticus]
MTNNFYLFTIAIDEYSDSHYPNLHNAKHDVERLVNILTNKYSFEHINSLTDKSATRENIIDKLNLLSPLLTKEDNLIIYYAGHGEQHPLSKKGFWVPFDASEKVSDLIPNSTIIDLIEGMEAKHILLISDSCFSGTFLTRTRSPLPNGAHIKLDQDESRWLLVSGREERVSDGQIGKGSPFANAICDFLETNTKEYTILTDFFTSVIQQTGKNASQQAIASHIEGVGHKGGQMVLRMNNPIKTIPIENKLGDLLTPFELSEQLKEIGLPQDSIFGYYNDNGEKVARIRDTFLNFKCSAYSTNELWKYIPSQIDIDGDTYLARTNGYDKISDLGLEDYDYAEVVTRKTFINDTPFMAVCECRGRMVAFSINDEGRYNNLICWGKSEAEVLGQMLLELIAEGRVTL